MSRAVEAAKWTGRLLLQVPIYLVTSYIVRQLLGGAYNLLIKAGAVLPSNLLLQHFLVVSLIGGFFAGLLGLLILKATFLLPFATKSVQESLLKRPQIWTWSFFTCWFLFGISVWIARNAHQSVLATHSGVALSAVIDAFFGSGCQLRRTDIHAMVFSECMTQLSFTHPWLGTIGYSAAAFVPFRWLMPSYKQPMSNEEFAPGAEGQKADELNHQERLAQ